MIAAAPTDLNRVDLDWEENRVARARLLQEAERLIENEMKVLQHRAGPSTCTECRLTHYRDFEAHQAAEALGGALGRVRKAREKLLDKKGGRHEG